MAILNNFYLMPFMGVTPSSKKSGRFLAFIVAR